MKLKEYIQNVTDVVRKHKWEGIQHATLKEVENTAVGFPEGKNVHDNVTSAIYNCLGTNKRLLGIYPPAGEPLPPKFEEKEITAENLKRHILQVRRDMAAVVGVISGVTEGIPELQHENNYENIAKRVLEKLTDVLKIKGLGKAFSETELTEYNKEFNPEPEAKPAPKPQLAPLADPQRIGPPSEIFPTTPPIASASKLEEQTRRAIDARNQARLKGMSEEDRQRFLEIEAKLRAEGKIV